ncbi:hypothetical protein A6E01_19230 (plasmid) [Vibrio breoganii]|uniref:TIGR03750 family conjugal transfer protein n=1 Tax=Vibrio breoganii TaxID=553239 RepID=A0AAN0XZG3_9VIBR|nr:DUF3487 family protein [Vibrio breoganii]ANO35348.1 hypothetical protein A6E01_19230 [Vibrio breoganii]PML12730.1 hypothetical protein BCT84_02275 [Vibrio breoganii]
MAKDEGTVNVVIDQLDFVPNAFLGFTNFEFIATICGASVAFVIPLSPLSSLILGKSIFGVIAAMALGVVFGVLAAARAETLKKGRPSYMIWSDLRRRLQIRGVLGWKAKFGFVETTAWDVLNERK